MVWRAIHQPFMAAAGRTRRYEAKHRLLGLIGPVRRGRHRSLRCAPVADHQVCVLGVAAQVGADERAEGHEFEVAGAEVVEGAGDQPSSEPCPSKAG